MVVVNRFLVPKGYAAITLFPFVFVREESKKNNKRLINHEKIHLRQQVELLIVFFYLWYVVDFLIKCVVYRGFNKAYRNIVFEREAYANQYNFEYLKHRKLFSFLKYF